MLKASMAAVVVATLSSTKEPLYIYSPLHMQRGFISLMCHCVPIYRY